MNCTNCGAELAPGVFFCGACGAATGKAKAVQPKAAPAKGSTADQVKGCAVLIVIGVVVMALLGQCDSKDDATKAAATAADRAKGFHCLSGWDGSNRSLVDQIKANLRDPGSFEHDETRITPANSEDKHIAIMRYRAKNGFGGMNVSEARATVDPGTCTATVISTGE